MTVSELINDLESNFKPDDKIQIKIKTDTGQYISSILKEIYTDPDDENCPVLSNEDEYGDFDGVFTEIIGEDWMDIPNSIEKLFSNGNQNYYLSDYDLQPMDNIESMEHFLEQVGVDNDNIETDDGNYIVLKHPDYDYKLEIQSEGMGDLNSHIWEVLKIKL